MAETGFADRKTTAEQPIPAQAGLQAGLTPLLVALVLMLIVVLAGVLRLWNLQYTSFTYDAARLSNLAAELVDEGKLPAQGMISSVGIQNPPIGVYLLALPVLFSRNPVVLTGFVALLNIGAVLGSFWLGRRFWRAEVGLVAALLFAVSPWAIEHARGILGQSVLPLGVVLFFSFLMLWFVEGRGWGLAAALTTLTALTQVHLSAVALAPIVAVLVVGEGIWQWRTKRAITFWRPLAFGLAASVLLYVPYLVSDARSNWSSLRQFTELAGAPSQLHTDVLDLALMAVSGRNIHALAGPEQFRTFLDQLVEPAYRLDRFEEWLAAISVFYLGVRVLRRWRRKELVRPDLVLLMWLAAPVLFFLRSSSEVFPHYFILLYPAPFLAIGVAGMDLVATVQRWPRFSGAVMAAAAGLLIVIAAWQSYLSLSIYRFIGTHDTPGGWGTPVAYLNDVASSARQQAALNAGTQVVMLCQGANPIYDECPAVFQFLAGRDLDLTFRDANDAGLAGLQNSDEALVIVAPGQSLAAEVAPRVGLTVPAADVALRNTHDQYRFYRVFNPYKAIAAKITAKAAEGDAILLVGPDQQRSLAPHYDGPLPVYELPAVAAGGAAVEEELAAVAARHGRLFVLYRASEASDPEGRVAAWLDANAYGAAPVWVGPVRFASYATQPELGGTPLLPGPLELGGKLQLTGSEQSAGDLAGGEALALRLAWQAAQAPIADYTVSVQLLDANNRVVSQRDELLRNNAGPTSLWAAEARGETRLSLEAAPGLAPGTYRLVAVVYDAATGERLSAASSDSIDLGAVRIREQILPQDTRPADAAPLALRHRPDFSFTDVTMVAHDRYARGLGHEPDAALHPGDDLHIANLWFADSKPSADWQVTVRLLDPRGQEQTRLTAPLAGERYPATAWLDGQLVAGDLDLPLPDSLKPGAYVLQAAVHAPEGDAADWRDLGRILVEGA